MATNAVVQQQQRFSFDLDTINADPYKQTFVFTFLQKGGWNVLPLLDRSLSTGSVLLIEHVEVTSAGACGQPYAMLHEDGRLVGRPTTTFKNNDLPRPPSFPKWAQWSSCVHGVCGLFGPGRSAVMGSVEALNEERFFGSELYMTLSQLVRSQEDDSSHYRLRQWQAQINAHIPPQILQNIRHGSVIECLKTRYLECPLVKTRPERPFLDLCLYLSAPNEDEDKEVHVAVTVSGKRISHICSPKNPSHYSNGQLTIDAFTDNLIQPIESGVHFDEFFRRFPIRFHRERIAIR